MVQIQTLNTSDFHGGCPKSTCSCSLTTAAQFCPNLTCCRNQISQVTLGINDGSKVQIPNWDNCIRQALCKSGLDPINYKSSFCFLKCVINSKLICNCLLSVVQWSPDTVNMLKWAYKKTDHQAREDNRRKTKRRLPHGEIVSVAVSDETKLCKQCSKPIDDHVC